MKETLLSEIEKINVILLIVGAMVVAVAARNFVYFLSFALGSAIMTLNFRFLRKIVEGIFSSEINKKSFLIKLPLKFLILVALVVVVFVYGNLSVLFLMLGLSTVIVSIVVSQIVAVFTPQVRRNQDGT
jgi:hypothetical protein